MSGVREPAPVGEAGSGNHLRGSLGAQGVLTQLLKCQELPKPTEGFNLPQTRCVCVSVPQIALSVFSKLGCGFG